MVTHEIFCLRLWLPILTATINGILCSQWRNAAVWLFLRHTALLPTEWVMSNSAYDEATATSTTDSGKFSFLLLLLLSVCTCILTLSFSLVYLYISLDRSMYNSSLSLSSEPQRLCKWKTAAAAAAAADQRGKMWCVVLWFFFNQSKYFCFFISGEIMDGWSRRQQQNVYIIFFTVKYMYPTPRFFFLAHPL